jgi:hypothetical protein
MQMEQPVEEKESEKPTRVYQCNLLRFCFSPFSTFYFWLFFIVMVVAIVRRLVRFGIFPFPIFYTGKPCLLQDNT